MYDALTSGKDYAHFTVLPERSCQIVVSFVRLAFAFWTTAAEDDDDDELWPC